MMYEIRVIVDGECVSAHRMESKPSGVSLILSSVEVVPESETVTELGSKEIVVP